MQPATMDAAAIGELGVSSLENSTKSTRATDCVAGATSRFAQSSSEDEKKEDRNRLAKSHHRPISPPDITPPPDRKAEMNLEIVVLKWTSRAGASDY